jgi:hypothetical protein
MRLRRAAAAANNNQPPLRWCGVCGMTWHLLPHPTAKTDSAKLCVIRLR